MWQNHRNLVKNQGMATSLIKLIEQRLNNITNRWRDVFNYRIDYFLRNSYGELRHVDTNEKEQTMKIVGFSGSLIIDTAYRFTNEQLQLLSRGPTYVPPCQMCILSSNESIDGIVKKQYAPLKHQLMSLFSKYKINLPLKIEIEEKTYNKFKDLFLKPIPLNLYQRALYEKKLIQSVRYSLNKNNLILRRTADNMNTFYVGNIQDFEAKADKYLTRSDEYKVLINMDEESNEQPLHTALKNMIESMNSLLEQSKTHKAIKEDLYNRLVVDPTKVKLPNLYFLPNVSKENDITLVPIITSKQSATWKIGKYLNQLLRPFADEKLHSTTFYNDADFIRKFNHYANTEHRLRPTTLFCTIKISNFYTMDIHKNMIDVVVGHSRLAYSDWLLSALIRAVCYCSTVDDFQLERIYLELTYLINGYSLLFVETHVKHFFNYFHTQSMRYSRNQSTYDKFRRQWFKFTVQRPELSEELQKFDDNDRLFQLNYIYDFGPKCRFNRDFRRLWSEYFKHHPILFEE
ncbi:unnamed protein product [Rotaria sp. Silwood2]|nr:unnamed protein product [Rotaria sp. Silwood2]